MLIPALLTALVAFVIWLFSREVDRELKNKLIPDSVLEWGPDVRRASALAGVPWQNVLAILWQESDGDPDAIGSAGEHGLMQLKDIAVQDVEQNFNVDVSNYDIDPWQNILAGAYFYKLQFKRTGDYGQAFEAYNQGFAGRSMYPDRAEKYRLEINQKLKVIQ